MRVFLITAFLFLATLACTMQDQVPVTLDPTLATSFGPGGGPGNGGPGNGPGQFPAEPSATATLTAIPADGPSNLPPTRPPTRPPADNGPGTPPATMVAPPSGENTRYAIGRIPVYETTDLESEVIDELLPGQPMQVIEIDGEWVNINYERGKTGWVRLAQTDTVRPDLPPPGEGSPQPPGQ